MRDTVNSLIAPAGRTRETVALAELARNEPTSRPTAWVLVVLFVLSIVVPAEYQVFHDEQTFGRSQFADLFSKWPTAESLSQFEGDLSAQSQFDRVVRNSFWHWQTGGIPPSGEILIGADGFLFHKAEISCFSKPALTESPPSPTASVLPTILDFAAQLRNRGIRMILLPVPFKISIYPEKLAIDYRQADGPAYPPGYLDWVIRARESGIEVIDLWPEFWKFRDPANPVFLRTDTHWSLRGRSLAADVVADYLRPLVKSIPPAVFKLEPRNYNEEGDLARLLVHDWGYPQFPKDQWISQAVMRNGKPLNPGDDARVLLIGDSFTSYYTEDGCGFSDELMQRLNIEIQAIGCKGDGVASPRQILADRPEFLKTKKIVIWEIAGHSLWNNWQKIELH